MRYRKGIFPANPRALAVALASIFSLSAAHAFDIDTGNPNFTARWDNTFKYSNVWRVDGPQGAVLGTKAVGNAPAGDSVNYDDGDRAFGVGPVSNRIDLLTELDLAWKHQFGVRASAAGWYDSIYNEPNANTLPFSSNYTVGPNKFSKDTRDIMGQYIELLDAFAWDKGMIGGMPYTVRVGRHTLQYGETLFYGGNGIANAQGPVDIIKLLNVPGSQFKEILRPVGQASFNLQVNENWTVDGYYQFQWEESRLPAAGSYLSSVDFVGPGSETLFVGPGVAFVRGGDIKASDQGQGGVAIHYNSPDSDYRYGLYFANYHDKTPELYLVPMTPRFHDGIVDIGQIREVYAENIKTFGASVTSSIGQLNWAAEVSWRIDQPLNSDPQLDLTGTADNNKNPLYAIGNTMHANLNGIYVLQPTKLWQGGAVLAEFAWNYLMECTRNCTPALPNGFNPTGARDPNATDHALIYRMIFDPAYFQVLPGLDIDVPIGFGYNIYGRSVVTAGPFEGDGTGDLSIGINGKYQQVWQFGLSYTHYIGSPNTYAAPWPNGGPAEALTFDQTLKDRDFVSFNVHRTF